MRICHQPGEHVVAKRAKVDAQLACSFGMRHLFFAAKGLVNVCKDSQEFESQCGRGQRRGIVGSELPVVF